MTNLDRCWKNCLRMWKWISENWARGMTVDTMKEDWLARHRFKRGVYNDCFFCEYMDEHREQTKHGTCDGCPGALVSRRFHCMNATHCFTKPKAFYAKLLQLDAKRKQIAK